MHNTNAHLTEASWKPPGRAEASRNSASDRVPLGRAQDPPTGSASMHTLAWSSMLEHRLAQAAMYARASKGGMPRRGPETRTLQNWS